MAIRRQGDCRRCGGHNSSDAGVALLHREGAEPTQLDALTASQSGSDLVEYRRDDEFSILLPQMRVAAGEFGEQRGFVSWGRRSARY